MNETPPLRQRIKEWGEAAEVWTKVGLRVGGFLFLAASGHSVFDILQKALS
jgi:hypothetical protein